MAEEGKLPAVPETILKRRKRQAENRTLRAKDAFRQKVAHKARRAAIFKREEKFDREFQDQERDEIRLKCEARKEGNYYVPGDPKLAFVLRIRGINQVSPKVKKVLQVFRLRQINNGVFIKLNKATTNMLRICGRPPDLASGASQDKGSNCRGRSGEDTVRKGYGGRRKYVKFNGCKGCQDIGDGTGGCCCCQGKDRQVSGGAWKARGPKWGS